MVASQVGTEGVAGDELRSARWLRVNWGFGLRWLPVEAEGLGGSARPRGVGWLCWMDGEGSGCGEWSWDMAAAEPAGVGEEGFPPTIAGCGGAMGVA